MHTLFTLITATVLSIGNFLGFHSAPAAPAPVAQAPIQLGGFNPTAGGTYRLQSSIGSSDTSLTLTSFKEPVSNIAYTMSYLQSTIEYATLEPQSSNKEFISFSGITQNSDGSATLTGLTRGLGFSAPYTASSTLQLTHSGQTILILSNSPQFYQQFASINNNETIIGDWLVPSPVNATSIANKNYVDGKIFGGIGNASETATGTVQIATQAQAAASTVSGTLGRLVLPSSIATSTYNAGSAVNVIPVTGAGGKLDGNFIATTTLFINSSLTGTTTLATTTINGGSPWLQLVSTTTANAMTFATTTFFAYSDLQIKIFVPGLTTTNLCVRFGTSPTASDSATNYASKISVNNVLAAATGGVDNVHTSMYLNTDGILGATTTDAYFSLDIKNGTTVRKQVHIEGSETPTGANSPWTFFGAGVWNNTIAAMTTAVFGSNIGTDCGTFPAGTKITVYGQ